MRTLEIRVFIDRPPQEVFDYMTDPANDTRWQEQLVASEWITPEPPSAGSTKRVITKVMGRETEAFAEYTAWERPNGYSFTSSAGPFTIGGTITLETQENGTLVTVKGVIEASGIMKLMEGLIIGRVEKQDQRNFNTLKRLLEAE